MAALGWGDHSSARGHTDNEVAGELLDLILKNGFDTNEPILVTQPAEMLVKMEAGPACLPALAFLSEQGLGLTEEWSAPFVEGSSGLRAGSVGYYKGKARASVLLAVLVVCKQRGLDVKQARL